MRNLAIDKARRAKIVSIEHIPDLDALGQADPAPDAHAHLAGRQELARLEAAIRALPAQCRQVVTLRKVFEMSPPQIAERLGISVSTVEKHLNKGMRLVAEALAFTPPPGDETDRSEWVKTTKTDERS
jgi:RNA polymerase sigma-70 factor (ECF subfamily)